MDHVRPRLGVSGCVLGEPVRHHGGHSRSRFLTDTLGAFADFTGICPELEIGLGVPRPPVRLVSPGRLISPHDGADHTAAVAAIAESHSSELERLAGYVLKGRSPSCGLSSAREYRAGEIVRANATGAFARQIAGAHPELPVEEDGRLNDPALREHFIERVFARARLLKLFAGPWRPRDLVDFHARHKLQLLGHSRVHYQELGQLVGQAGRLPAPSVRTRYASVFGRAMSVRTTVNRQVDVLHHAFGMVGKELDQHRRHDILAVIAAYRVREVPLSVPVTLIRHYAAGYLAGQTYLDPFPAALGLRNQT